MFFRLFDLPIYFCVYMSVNTLVDIPSVDKVNFYHQTTDSLSHLLIECDDKCFFFYCRQDLIFGYVDSVDIDLYQVVVIKKKEKAIVIQKKYYFVRSIARIRCNLR
jgi:hypothetical protein